MEQTEQTANNIVHNLAYRIIEEEVQQEEAKHEEVKHEDEEVKREEVNHEEVKREDEEVKHEDEEVQHEEVKHEEEPQPIKSRTKAKPKSKQNPQHDAANFMHFKQN